VRGHALTLGAIEEAAAQALVVAGPDAESSVLLSAAERAARTFTSDRLAQIADRLSTTLTWDDLVLPNDIRAEVDEVWRAAAARRQVFEQWGFEQRTPYGRAVSALFTGEPGTGKTMCATLVARELGVELYRVDLSKLVDKYIGETEKHLATLFSEAERGRCVLLFDEADSLFGKRTKGGESATERYANLEVNYLLQRIETFSGIVILTTNQESVIDDAFKRRLRYRVSFPFPSEDERALMWRRLIPPEAPTAGNLEPEALARKFRLSGGHMKSAVLRAAFAASAAGVPISQEHLVRAANQELENIGKLVVG
jgi:SpoVK/Ycf46/Vps4 family AAA+-type ATPase